MIVATISRVLNEILASATASVAWFIETLTTALGLFGLG